MPAQTSPDNLTYPVLGDNLAPLQAWFGVLASDTQTALTAIRDEAVADPLPDPATRVGAPVQAVTATSWSDLPNITNVELVLAKPCWVQITIGAWVVALAGDTRASVRISGATTVSESEIEVGGNGSAWGQVLFATPNHTQQRSATRTVRLNAGANTITYRAYRSGTGANNVNYSTMQVVPLRWA